jgi:hypothetical protein
MSSKQRMHQVVGPSAKRSIMLMSEAPSRGAPNAAVRPGLFFALAFSSPTVRAYCVGLAIPPLIPVAFPSPQQSSELIEDLAGESVKLRRGAGWTRA